MLKIKIPGMETLEIEHLVLDYNGTIAFDGKLKDAVAARLEILSGQLMIHVLTADTYGSVHAQCDAAHIHVHVIGKERQAREKLDYIASLGAELCIAVGNGKNDALMLDAAMLGIAVIQEEGASMKTVMQSDVVFLTIEDALDALLNPNRLIATLRN